METFHQKIVIIYAFPFCGNPRLHSLHLKTVSPVCLCSCKVRWLCRLKLLTQWEHLKGLSPVSVRKKNQNPIFFYEYNTHGSSDVFLADCSLCISFHRTRIRIISPLHGQLSCDTSEWLESHKPCCTQNRQTFPGKFKNITYSHTRFIGHSVPHLPISRGVGAVDSFLVWSEISLIFKAFCTVRTNKWPIFWVVWGLMVFQTIRSSKRFITNFTNVRTFVCMQLDVVPKGGLVRERLRAGETYVRSLTGMNSEVLLQIW